MKHPQNTIGLFFILMLNLTMLSATYAGELISVVESRFAVPPTADITDSIGNGGFFISGYGRGSYMGDGADENTVWFHSFRLNRDQWKTFTTANPPSLYSANLVLKYTPTHRAAYNDFIQIAGLRGIPITAFTGFENGPLEPRHRRIVISVNLLDHYSSEEILNAMKNPLSPSSYANWTGNILMRYADDATIHYAKLTLQY